VARDELPPDSARNCWWRDYSCQPRHGRWPSNPDRGSSFIRHWSRPLPVPPNRVMILHTLLVQVRQDYSWHGCSSGSLADPIGWASVTRRHDLSTSIHDVADVADRQVILRNAFHVSSWLASGTAIRPVCLPNRNREVCFNLADMRPPVLSMVQQFRDEWCRSEE
jgi:hypothetical protein